MFKETVQQNEEVVKGEIKELVREAVEETFNQLLEQEMEKLTHAARYERTEARKGYRSSRRDVSSGSIHSPYRRHHRRTLGNQSLIIHHQRA